MATRQLLATLLTDWSHAHPQAVDMRSVGGVDAARQVQAGALFDVVVLASDAIDKLVASGHVRAGSKVDLVHSGVAVAVPEGAPRPDLSSAAAVRAAVLAAPSLGYSTGPSGVALVQQFERWGILSDLQGRLVQASPGVPVGALVSEGKVALGFQQLSELLNVPGIDLLGPLPADMQIVTTFSGAVCSAARQPEAAQALLAYLASASTAEVKRRHGMEPA
jgi:molybdate transport system substrate-binding protein